MRLRNYSPIYGYSAPAAIAFRAVPSSIQQGAGGSDSLALSAALTNILPNQVTSAITHGVEDQNLFFLDNYEVKFEEMISGLMGTVKIPVDPTFSVHWLAIEGVQPAIPQNPAPMHTAKLDNSAEFQAKDVSAISGIEGVPVVTKPLVKHVLSKEQLQYFEYIRYAIKQGSCPSANLSDTDVQLLNAALTSISSDAGLHQLMPYFAQFINDEVNKNLTNLYMLKSLMRMTRAILNSPHLHVEPYVRSSHFSCLSFNIILLIVLYSCIASSTNASYPYLLSGSNTLRVCLSRSLVFTRFRCILSCSCL